MKIQTPNHNNPQGNSPRPIVRSGGDEQSFIVDSFRPELRTGQKVTFEFSNGKKFVLENTDAPEDKSLSGITQFFKAAAQEVQVAVNAGPSLALTGITEVIKPLLLNGVPGDAGSMVEQWYGPAIQGVSIVLSLEKFLEVYKSSHAKKMAGKKLDVIDYASMGANFLHMGTSTASLLGSLAGAINPNLAHLGAIGRGIGLAGDCGAFAVSWMQYANDRSEIINIDEWQPQKKGPPTN